MQPSPLSNFGTFSSAPRVTLYPLAVIPYSSPCKLPAATDLCLFWTFIKKWNHSACDICVWLFSLIMFSSFIHVVACITTSFLFLDQVIFHFMYISHFIHPFINRWTFGLLPLPIFFASNIQLSWILLLWIFVYTFLCELVYNSLGYIPSEESLGHMVTLCSTGWRTDRLFSIVTAPFYNPSSSVWRAWISPHLPRHYFFLSFDFNHGYVVLKWYFIIFFCFPSG